MFKRTTLLGLITLVVALPLHAQHYNIVKFGVREGLLHSLVTGIAQDKKGDIWMSTGGGLCRFNGVEYSYITTRDGLNFTRLTCVATDDDDNVWVGSSKGINFIHGNAVFSVNSSLIGNEILTIASAGRTSVWTVTNDGLFNVQYSGRDFLVSKVNVPSFQSSEIVQIFQDRVLSNFILKTSKGKVYFGNNGVLFLIRDNYAVQILLPKGILANTGKELADGSILLGTNKGLFKLSNNCINPLDHPLSANIDIKDLCVDGNKIWVLGKELTVGNSFNVYALDLTNKKYFHRISAENGLTQEPTQIFLDHEYNLWAISNNGVFLLKGNAFTAFTIADGLVGNKVWALSKSSDGILWVGTIGEGMSVIKDGKTYNYTKSNGLPDNYVGKIYQTKQGDVLIGTSNAGLNRAIYSNNLNAIRFERLPLLSGIRFRIDDILEDNRGKLWVASSKGLYFTKDKRNFTRMPLSSLDTGEVFVQRLLLDTMRNEMWIGTRYNGVYILHENTVKPFSPIDSNEEISSLAMDNQRNIWIGTRNKGVFRWDYSTLRQFSEKDGLVSNLTYILYPDSRNNLWIGSNLGLDRIDLAALSRNEKNYIRHYGSDEGLVDLETNLNGVISDEFGFLLSTNGGLLKYEQDADKLNSVPPKVRITGLKLRSQETDWLKYSSDVDAWNGLPNKLKLKYDQNHLTFEFVGVSFRNPRLVQYAWKLDGFDDKWITSTSRQAIYSNLPPGKYIFRLKAANSDLFWSDEVKSMPFVILPPFWATWWFRVLLILLIGLAIYLYVLSRIRTLREKQKELEGLVTIRTAELREQFQIVDDKNRQILDSLKYAKFLQSAILRSVDDIKENFADAFVFYKPKDFVSGDFYWFSRYNNISVFAVADCTGHGVPGAIISVICESSLRQAVLGCMYENPAKILEFTNKYVIDTFSQTNKDIHDGMEIALCTFNHQTNELTYCGAKLGVYLFANNNFVKLKPSIQRIGWDRSPIKFENQTLVLEPGSMIYMFTDGFGDQFDYKSKEKFSSVRLRKLLESNANLPAEEQHNILENEFNRWKGDNEQIDDVLVLGIKF